MDNSRKNLTILAVIIGVIWLVLLYTQIHLTERVFYSYRQIFQNKLDLAVKQSFRDLDKSAFTSCFGNDFHDEMMRFREYKPVSEADHSTLPPSPFTETLTKKINAFVDYMSVNGYEFNYHSMSYATMDSLISVALHDNFIYEPFQVGLYCSNKSGFFYLSEGADQEEILQHGFQYALPCVTSDGRIGNDQLYLFFPNLQNRFHWDIVTAFVVIILLLVILLYCFIYFITIVIRQRKIIDFRTNMLNNITHELKTPITTISLAGQLLRDESVQKDQHAYEDYLNIISEETDSLLNLVDEALTVFRGERIPFKELTDVEIHPLIKDAVNNNQLQLNQCNAVVNFYLQAENDVVSGSRDHLLNGFSNLIDNAIKYRSGDLVIDISTRNVGNTIEIQVKDNGIGIDKSNQTLIFEPFSRVNTDNKHYVKGYGLGLNYLNQIVKYHKGTIKVESELGKGATFFVSLPLNIK